MKIVAMLTCKNIIKNVLMQYNYIDKAEPVILMENS